MVGPNIRLHVYQEEHDFTTVNNSLNLTRTLPEQLLMTQTLPIPLFLATRVAIEESTRRTPPLALDLAEGDVTFLIWLVELLVCTIIVEAGVSASLACAHCAVLILDTDISAATTADVSLWKLPVVADRRPHGRLHVSYAGLGTIQLLSLNHSAAFPARWDHTRLSISTSFTKQMGLAPLRALKGLRTSWNSQWHC